MVAVAFLVTFSTFFYRIIRFVLFSMYEKLDTNTTLPFQKQTNRSSLYKKLP
jgi:hypothetical protein